MRRPGATGNGGTTMPCHSECKYHGFFGLVEWCRHPDHVEPLEPARKFAIMSTGGKYPNHIEWEAKVMPGVEPPWPMPVHIRQLTAVLAISVRHAYKIEEMSAKNDTRAA